MTIEKIILKNYRQFRDIELSFTKRSDADNDLHVIIAVMGTGKTNILNAINWCLYKEEPYLSKESQQLPILNLKTILASEEGEDKEVKVEVWVKTKNNRRIIFIRREKYRVYGQGEKPQSLGETFKVAVTDEKGNSNIYEGEEADYYRDRFVPIKIRDFFFFDGERLDRYFKEATSQNIRSAILGISQLEVLEKVREKIDKYMKEISKKAGKLIPEVENIRKDLEQQEQELDKIKEQIEECNKQISIAKEKIKECEENLKNVPDVEILEEERKSLIKQRNDKEILLREKINEKEDLLFEYGKIIMLWPAIKKAIEIIGDKKKAKEIPPTIDKVLLANIISSGVCSVCGRKLDSESKANVKELFERIAVSSEVGQQLLSMENPLIQYKEKIKTFKKNIFAITQEIQMHQNDLDIIVNKISEIDKKLSGYNLEKIKDWHEERRKYEGIRDLNNQKLGSLKTTMEQLQKKIDHLNELLDKEIKKEEKTKKLKEQIDFCNKSLSVLTKIKDKIMKEIKNDIEYETNKLFFELIWKKDSFKNIIIDDDYNINLIHSMGYECLGSISGGEREVLTLAFTIALHKISGFDSPIIVDRPLAMVSGDPRKNIVNIFSQLSKGKQLILLFTPDDYSSDISSILDSNASNKYTLLMSSDEKEVEVS